MRFEVGDIVHNKITREEGRIVRIAECTRPCYVVSVALDQTIWHAPAREALWSESEVKK
jgi:hypothetical protein